jgi:hypothetical protein
LSSGLASIGKKVLVPWKYCLERRDRKFGEADFDH